MRSSSQINDHMVSLSHMRRYTVDDWMLIDLDPPCTPDGSWLTMMRRVAAFHSKHNFASDENNGHDMGYRISLTIEELGELSASITKGKPKEEAAEELADLLILILGHSLAMSVDLEDEFHKKMDKIMKREAKRGNLGLRVTEYLPE